MIHLAALQVPFVRADPVLGARVNVVGTVNVLEAVRRRADRMGPLVYASSIAVYGAAGTLAADDHPGTLYGVFKRANEGTALRYFEDYGVSSIGLRPHTVYGPARDQGLTSARRPRWSPPPPACRTTSRSAAACSCSTRPTSARRSPAPRSSATRARRCTTSTARSSRSPTSWA